MMASTPHLQPRSRALATNRHPATSVMFTRFPELPIELRLKIWGHAAQQPRIIGLRGGSAIHSFNGTAARCPLLRVSTEARHEALRVKEDLNKTGSHENQLEARIYVNLQIDTLWLTDIRSHGITMRKTLAGLMENVRILAMPFDKLKFNGAADPRTTSLSSDNPPANSIIIRMNLEEVIFIVRSESIVEGEQLMLVSPRSHSPVTHALLSQSWEEAAGTYRGYLGEFRNYLRNQWDKVNLGSIGKNLEDAKRERERLLKWKVPEIRYMELVKTSSVIGAVSS